MSEMNIYFTHQVGDKKLPRYEFRRDSYSIKDKGHVVNLFPLPK